MKKLMVLIAVLASMGAHAVKASVANNPQAYEAARKAAVSKSTNGVELMDSATPEELERMLNLKPGQNSGQNSDQNPEMVRDENAEKRMSRPNPNNGGGLFDWFFNGGAPSAPTTPQAGQDALVQINVSIATQSLEIEFPGGSYQTIISSARAGYHTATGCFSHPHLELMHYSSKYENSPMPHAMFFDGGYAIHGTLEESELGRPASHGCVRVSLNDATYLYGIVEQFGAPNTRICVQ